MGVKNTAPGKHADGAGLWLHRRHDGGAQWFLRFVVHGRRREMGLGSLNNVSLKEARQLADKWRSIVREGKDPIKERSRLQREAEKTDSRLQNIAEEAFEARKAELKDDGNAGRWFSPLANHVLPKLGKVPVEELDQLDIKNTLQPIWHSKSDVARKAMNRLGIVLRHAAAMNYDVDLQATQKAKALLGKSRHQAKNIPALHWRGVPEFYRGLGDRTMSEVALRLLILTAVRSGSLRNARWDQFDSDTWTIPADNMKGRIGEVSDFAVPLSDEALAVLDLMRPFERGGFVFPGQKKGVMSDMAMTKFLRDKGYDFRPHGFRSSFKTWCSEAADVPHEVSEAALGHVGGSKVVRAYNRTTYLEKRRPVMCEWAAYVTGPESMRNETNNG